MTNLLLELIKVVDSSYLDISYFFGFYIIIKFLLGNFVESHSNHNHPKLMIYTCNFYIFLAVSYLSQKAFLEYHENLAQAYFHSI